MSSQALDEKAFPIVQATDDTGKPRSLYIVSAIQPLSNRLQYPGLYTVYYVTLLALSTPLVMLGLRRTRHYPKDSFYILYNIVGPLTVGEVALRVLVTGNRFWVSSWHTADLLLSLLVVMTYPMSLVPGPWNEFVDIHLTVAAGSLLFIRVVTHFVRFILVMKSYARQQSSIEITQSVLFSDRGVDQLDVDDFEMKLVLQNLVSSVSDYGSLAVHTGITGLAIAALVFAVRQDRLLVLVLDVILLGEWILREHVPYAMFAAPTLGIFDFILILFSGVNIVLLATLGRRPRLVLGIINSSLMLLRSVVQTSFVVYKFVRSRALVSPGGP